MKESKIQKKIMMHLEANGFDVIDVITASKSGIADILACSPQGYFWAIEVKTTIGRASALQKRFIAKISAKPNAEAFFAYGYEDYLLEFEKRTIT